MLLESCIHTLLKLHCASSYAKLANIRMTVYHSLVTQLHIKLLHNFSVYFLFHLNINGHCPLIQMLVPPVYPVQTLLIRDLRYNYREIPCRKSTCFDKSVNSFIMVCNEKLSLVVLWTENSNSTYFFFMGNYCKTIYGPVRVINCYRGAYKVITLFGTTRLKNAASTPL